MTLTKEDLDAIRIAIKEEVDIAVDEKLEKFERKLDEKFEEKLDVKLEQKLSPICEALKKLVQTQILVVEDLADIKSKVNILIYNAALPSASHELRNSLKTLH